MGNSNFIRQKGNYEELLCYKKSICVYDTLSPFSLFYLSTTTSNKSAIKQTRYQIYLSIVEREQIQQTNVC